MVLDIDITHLCVVLSHPLSITPPVLSSLLVTQVSLGPGPVLSNVLCVPLIYAALSTHSRHTVSLVSLSLSHSARQYVSVSHSPSVPSSPLTPLPTWPQLGFCSTVLCVWPLLSQHDASCPLCPHTPANLLCTDVPCLSTQNLYLSKSNNTTTESTLVKIKCLNSTVNCSLCNFQK